MKQTRTERAQGHGYFRKMKKGLACGIALTGLGMLSLATGTTFAEEVTSDATNTGAVELAQEQAGNEAVTIEEVVTPVEAPLVAESSEEVFVAEETLPVEEVVTIDEPIMAEEITVSEEVPVESTQATVTETIVEEDSSPETVSSEEDTFVESGLAEEVVVDDSALVSSLVSGENAAEETAEVQVLAAASAGTSQTTSVVETNLIVLNGTTATTTSDFVVVDEVAATVTIIAGGDYTVTGEGSLQLLIAETVTDDVYITLENAILAAGNAAILSNSKKNTVYLILPEDTTSVLSDSETNSNKGAIQVKGNLVIEGSGTLEVHANGESAHAIKVGDAMTVTDATLILTSTYKDGIHTDETVEITNADITITALAGDGIQVEDEDNTGDANQGNLIINSGNITITSDGQSLQATATVTINGGTINLTSIDSEGIEGRYVIINGGDITIDAYDDGINATDWTTKDSYISDGGTLSNGFTTAQMGIEIHGGNLTVSAGGDGLDSNGYILIDGGTTVVYSTGASDATSSALDHDGTATINGGEVWFISRYNGMIETFDGGSQAYVLANTSGNANSTITVAANGSTLASLTAPGAYTSVIYSGSALVNGQSYAVNNTTTTATTSRQDGFGMGMGGQMGQVGQFGQTAPTTQTNPFGQQAPTAQPTQTQTSAPVMGNTQQTDQTGQFGQVIAPTAQTNPFQNQGGFGRPGQFNQVTPSVVTGNDGEHTVTEVSPTTETSLPELPVAEIVPALLSQEMPAAQPVLPLPTEEIAELTEAPQLEVPTVEETSTIEEVAQSPVTEVGLIDEASDVVEIEVAEPILTPTTEVEESPVVSASELEEVREGSSLVATANPVFSDQLLTLVSEDEAGVADVVEETLDAVPVIPIVEEIPARVTEVVASEVVAPSETTAVVETNQSVAVPAQIAQPSSDPALHRLVSVQRRTPRRRKVRNTVSEETRMPRRSNQKRTRLFIRPERALTQAVAGFQFLNRMN